LNVHKAGWTPSDQVLVILVLLIAVVYAVQALMRPGTLTLLEKVLAVMIAVVVVYRFVVRHKA
jgi:hypothetical protein